MQCSFAMSSHISVRTRQSVSPREGQVFLSDTANGDTISLSVKMFFVDIITSSAGQNYLLYICSDICSYASVQTCWTGNKSDCGVRGVMFNNKKYYLPRSMYVAIAIKYNEWKRLEACSKLWCVLILNTLWQHSARQGCKTSSNRLLNIRLLHPCTPWVPYIKPVPQHAKAKRDDTARSKIGAHDIFIRPEWALRECAGVNEWCAACTFMCTAYVCDRRRESSINQSIKAACDSDMNLYDWWMDQIFSSLRLSAYPSLMTFTPVLNKPRSRWLRPTCTQKTFMVPSQPPVALDSASHATLKAATVGRLRVFKNVISNAQMS